MLEPMCPVSINGADPVSASLTCDAFQGAVEHSPSILASAGSLLSTGRRHCNRMFHSTSQHHFVLVDGASTRGQDRIPLVISCRHDISHKCQPNRLRENFPENKQTRQLTTGGVTLGACWTVIGGLATLSSRPGTMRTLDAASSSCHICKWFDLTQLLDQLLNLFGRYVLGWVG